MFSSISVRSNGFWPRITRAMQIYVERVKCQLGRGSLPICISIRLLSNARTTRLFDIGLDIEFYFQEEKRERGRKKIKRRGIKKKNYHRRSSSSSSSSFSILADYFFSIQENRTRYLETTFLFCFEMSNKNACIIKHI